jgi:hypothetical protein
MPLVKAPAVRVIYPECNSLPTGPSGDSYLLWDTFYDLAQDAVAPTALASLGLSYSSGIFTATARCVLSVDLGFYVAATPGGACQLMLMQPGYDNNPFLLIPSPNTIGQAQLHKLFGMVPGDTFKVKVTCTNGTDTPLTYAAMNVVRLS